MKKVLIVTMTTGEGHNALARAFSAQLANENVELKTVQLYYYSERRVAFENKLYLTGCKFFPKTYDFFWNKLVNRDPEKRDKLTIHRTMRKAQKNPEMYKDLQIRVSGWNVLFNNINAEEQEGFIRQAEIASL